MLHPDEVKENQFDIVIEVAGAKESFEQSIDIVKPGGKIVAIGFTNMAEVPVTKLVRKEITIKGSIIYSVPEDFIYSIDYLMDSYFHVEPVISQYRFDRTIMKELMNWLYPESIEKSS